MGKRLRHLAIRTHQPGEAGCVLPAGIQHEGSRSNKTESIQLSDGEVNLAVAQRHESQGARATERRTAAYAESRDKDPDGNRFDICTVGWGPNSAATTANASG
jgi:hypothetical protein